MFVELKKKKTRLFFFEPAKESKKNLAKKKNHFANERFFGYRIDSNTIWLKFTVALPTIISSNLEN